LRRKPARGVAAPDPAGSTLLREAADALGLSVRGYHRTLRTRGPWSETPCARQRPSHRLVALRRPRCRFHYRFLSSSTARASQPGSCSTTPMKATVNAATPLTVNSAHRGEGPGSNGGGGENQIM